MPNPTSSVDRAGSAFLEARGQAQGTSGWRLRRKVRRLERRRGCLDVEGLARLKAYRYELADR